MCCKHYWEDFKQRDPVKYTYHYVKNNAKRRGKEWGLSIEDFRKFCEEHKYIKKKGKQRWSMSIDRIDNNRGYFIDNIRPLFLGFNAAKGTLTVEECPF